MGVVDWEYYSNDYQGQEADPDNFYTLNAHASRMIDALTHWQVTEDTFPVLPSLVQTLYKLAVCSQIDYLAINGLESVNTAGGVGFTVGKVTVHGAQSGKAGAMSGKISPAAQLYLEQSGLMNPAVPVVGCCVC